MPFWVYGVLLLLCGITFVYKAYAISRQSRNKKKQLAALAVALGSRSLPAGAATPDSVERSAGLAPSVQVNTAELDGLPFSYFHEDKYDRLILTAEIPAAATGALLARRETPSDRLFRRPGMSVELQNGGSEFDRIWHVESDPPELAQRLFADPGRREAAGEIVVAGFSSFKLVGTGKQITVTATAEDPGGRFYEQPERVRDTVRRMRRLAQSLPAVGERRQAREETRPTHMRKITVAARMASLWILVGGFLVQVLWVHGLFFMSGHQVLDSEAMLYTSLKFSLPLVVAYLLLVAFDFRGYPGALGDVLVCGGMAIVGIPLAIHGGMNFIDTALDFSEIQFHETRLVDVLEHGSTRTSRSSYAAVESWREQGKVEQIKLGAWTSASLEAVKYQHPVVRVGTRRGVLGYEWIANVE